jgi:DNA uptake protein ComE-like DNA-binding protein
MNLFKKNFREYNNFSKGDRHAILILASLALITLIGAIVIRHIDLFPEKDYTYYRELAKNLVQAKSENPSGVKSLFYFDPNTISKTKLDSLNLPEFVKRNMFNYRNSGGLFKHPEDVRKIYGMNDSLFSEIEVYIRIKSPKEDKVEVKQINKPELKGSFDPNTANSDELLEFGLTRFQVNNLIGYRGKGGVFKIPADVLKIYGIDSVTFSRIESFIKINEIQVPDNSDNKVLVELNSADTTVLMTLNGIGSAYARRIIKYREILGGFYNNSQLLEIYNFPQETYQKVKDYFYVDTLSVHKIRINFAEYKDFIRHPYFNKQQVDAILKYRQKNGPFYEIEQLRKEKLLDEPTFLKIRPYLTCR